MANQNAIEKEKNQVEDLDYDDLERRLQEEFSDLGDLEEQTVQIGNPDALGETVLNVICEQFKNQISVQAGEDFVKANNGLKLDLSDDAHIQTTENFEHKKIATHNTEINYTERYEIWDKNFQHDEKGNIIKHKTRSGREEATLVKGARAKYDAGRPKGSAEKHTDMDHTVSAGERMRDAKAGAHVPESENIKNANSDKNLNEMDSSQNRSKGDTPTEEWLDTPNANGQKPREIFNINKEDEAKLRQKDKEARDDWEKLKEEGEKRSIEAGKKSQKAEAFRIGKKAARAVVMTLLAELVRKIISYLIRWIKSSEKNLSSLIAAIKGAIKAFVGNLKDKVVVVADTVATTIATSICGPIVGIIKKVWMSIKNTAKSLKEAYNYIKDPANKKKPVQILMLEISKIFITGFTAGGAIAFGGAIETALKAAIPGFAIEIPFFGNLANIIGIFMGTVAFGVVGALFLDLINRLIASKKKMQLEADKIDKKNEILKTQGQLIMVEKAKLQDTKGKVTDKRRKRHDEASLIMREALGNIRANSLDDNDTKNYDEDFQEMDEKLYSLLGGKK